MILDLGGTPTRRDRRSADQPECDTTTTRLGAATSAGITRDIGWVRYPNLDEKAFPHSDIRPAFDTYAGLSEVWEAMADQLFQFLPRSSRRDRDDQFVLPRRQLQDPLTLGELHELKRRRRPIRTHLCWAARSWNTVMCAARSSSSAALTDRDPDLTSALTSAIASRTALASANA